MLTAERVRELLDYDAETGIFTRKVSKGPWKAGAAMGGTHSEGYTLVSADGGRYLAHRLAWLWVHGEWPPGDVDHINGVRTDNRLANLRLATRGENMQNVRRAKKNSQTGLLGAHPHPTGKFAAQIRVDGVTKHLGLFLTAEEAHAAYIKTARKIHPFKNL